LDEVGDIMKKISKSLLSLLLLSFMVFFVVGCQNNEVSAPKTPVVITTVEAPATNTTPVIPNDTTTQNNDNLNVNSSTVLKTLTTKELHIEAYNCGFSIKPQVRINKGDTVKLFLTSAQGTHDLVMPYFNVNITSIIPGEEKMVEFVAKYSGTYKYFSTIPCGNGQITFNGRLEVLP
jgi:heme/copper-type cytochrome/quinol oxidase subunit 2